MGDRITIQFIEEVGDGFEESPCLYSHWGGKKMVTYVTNFMYRFGHDIKGEGKSPHEVMVMFIMWLNEVNTWEENEALSLYLFKDEDDCDLSDNGLWVYNLTQMRWE